MAEKLFTVKTPNPGFNGSRNRIPFKNGQAKATYAQAMQLVNQWGYSCPELESAPVKESEPALSKKAEPIPQRSANHKKWRYAVELLRQMDSEDEITAFITGDARKSVNQAANERIRQLIALQSSH